MSAQQRYRGVSMLLHVLLVVLIGWMAYAPHEVPPKQELLRVSLSVSKPQDLVPAPQPSKSLTAVSKKKQLVKTKPKPKPVVKQIKKISTIEPQKLAKIPKQVWQQSHQEALDAEWQSLRSTRQQDAITKIRHHIQTFWYIPVVASAKQTVQLQIQTDVFGHVKSISVKKSSGSAMLDQASTEAVWAASPLPMPDDNDLSQDFRSFGLVMRPETITGIS